MASIKEAPAEIKVNTQKFKLKKGRILIEFSLPENKGTITGLRLKKRNELEREEYPFELTKAADGGTISYKAMIDVNGLDLSIAFWDVVAEVLEGDETTDKILGGLSSKLKLKLIAFPRWTKTAQDTIIYPFVNGARQFTIQHRKFDKRYDTKAFLFKEWLALFCYFILKPYWDSKKIWLVCEKFCTMAQDNGLYFFKFCMEKLPEADKKNIYYVIDKSCSEYAAVKDYEPNVISFMTFKYMIYLNAAEYLISSDAIRHFYAWDSPNSIFKVQYQARKHIVFLQHGVMGFKQCHRTFHKKGGNRMTFFVVSSEYEQDIIYDYFEYDRNEIIITGLPRWDVLHDTSAEVKKKEILLMPTWRGWLEDASAEEFMKSDYYRNYQSFISSQELHEILVKYDLVLNFYIHPKFRDYIGSFAAQDERIRMIPFGSEPLNKLLMSCSMLITDYSSVAWDTYYQEKPVVFFTFDYDTYNEVQGSYMDLRTEAFGDVVNTADELLSAVSAYAAGGFNEKDEYKKRRDYLLPYRDDDNSRRIYEAIKGAKLYSKFKTRLKEKTF